MGNFACAYLHKCVLDGKRTLQEPGFVVTSGRGLWNYMEMHWPVHTRRDFAGNGISKHMATY